MVQRQHGGQNASRKRKTSEFPIGIFDSGLGGLTVLTQLRKQLPQESIVYVADTARVPYGPRPTWEIEQFVREIIDYLLNQSVKMIVMACNTSSALVLDKLRPEVPVPMLGILLPGARAAVQALVYEHQRAHGRIGLWATAATVQSEAYQRAIYEASPQSTVEALACPEFVPLIERGACDPDHPEHLLLRQTIQQYLSVLQQWPLEVLIYGCTHYPLLEPLVAEYLPHIPRIDPAMPTVAAVAQELKALGLIRRGTARYRFCISGDVAQFERTARPWLPSGYLLEQVQWATAVVPVPQE